MVSLTVQDASKVSPGLSAHPVLAPPMLTHGAQAGVAERAFLGMVRIQLLARDAILLGQLSECLGVLPDPGFYTQQPSRRIHWLTPTEYLVVVEANGEPAVMDLLAHLPVYLSVVSDSRLTLGLEGGHVPELLARRCALDLRPQVFTSGRSTVTRLAGLPVMVTRLEGDCYELTIDRCYGEYLWACVAEVSGA